MTKPLKGIVSPQKVKEPCGLMRELNRSNINESDRERLLYYTKLQRCFTTPGAVRITCMYAMYQPIKAKKLERNKQVDALREN